MVPIASDQQQTRQTNRP